MPPRLTLQSAAVLAALLQAPERELYGLQLVQATGLPPGTIYPILARYETAGWIASRWEDTDPREAGRPRRRYYRFAADPIEGARDGATAAQLALAVAEDRRRARRRVSGPAADAGAAAGIAL